MNARLVADRARCIGAAACLGSGSSLLTLDGNGKIEVLNEGEFPPEEQLDVEDAVAFCPVSALKIED
jgi:ferredoxin